MRDRDTSPSSAASLRKLCEPIRAIGYPAPVVGHKEQLRKGHTWPITRRELLGELDELHAPHPSRVSRVSDRWDWIRQPNWSDDWSLLLNVEYLPFHETSHAPWSAGNEFVDVAFSSVPAEQRAAARRQLFDTVIPQLARWLHDARDAPEGWRILKHEERWWWRSGPPAESVQANYPWRFRG
jgi:hypothetical protein